MIALPLATNVDIAQDLVILVLAAVLGGYVATLLRAPLVAGYILGGLVVGPSILSWITQIDQVAFIGELGIALLLFSIGLEFSFEQFALLGRRVYIAALVQIAILGAGGYALAAGFGLSAPAAALVSGTMAFSSTALLVRFLALDPNRRRGDRQWALAIALVQDMVAVPFLVVVPRLGDAAGMDLAVDVLVAVGKGIGLVIGVVAVGRVAVPWILHRALATRSREMFLLTVFALASGVAVGSYAVGLSIAFGAFLAGVVTAQSLFASRALHELMPLRDLFAATFFVSIGVLLELEAVRAQWDLFLTLLLWGAIAKAIVIMVLARWSGFAPGQALRVGLLLGQVGEFAFLFTETAGPAATEEAGSVIVAVAAVSLAISALIVRTAGQVEAALLRVPAIARRWTPAVEEEVTEELRGHAVIAGFGVVGQEVAAALTARNLRFVAVDSDPSFPQRMRDSGLPYIWGDLANPATLEPANLSRARVLVVTLPDPVVVEHVVVRARDESARLDIVARADSAATQARLLDLGATSVVRLDLEMGLEMAFHALRRYGVTASEARLAQARRRRGTARE